MNKAKKIIEFMNIAEGLKRELRHSWLSDGRRESVAEHVWSMSLLVLLLFDEIDAKVDQLKVLKMIIIHDLVEIYAGDMPSFEAAAGGQEQKEKDEQEALEKLLEKLSNVELQKEIRDLWYEFEDKNTIESKLAQACDKAEAIIQHNNADISSFSQGDYDINPYYKDHLFNFDEFIREFKDEIDRQTMEKIVNEGDISKVRDTHKNKWEKQKNTTRKILLLDFDGVISPGKYFSEIYSEKFGVSIDKILPFFNEMKDSANIGKADLKEMLGKVLNEWEWKGTVDELLDFWFNADSDIDERVKEVAESLKSQNIPVYLATDQEKYRTRFIWEERKLNEWLDDKFVSCEIGFHKSDRQFFEHVINKLDVKPSQIIFFDDSQSKIDSAKKAGIDAYLYTDFESFNQKIQDLFKV